MDNTKPMYVDAKTGTYGEAKDLIMVNLSAGELYHFDSMSDSEIISYALSVAGRSLSEFSNAALPKEPSVREEVAKCTCTIGDPALRSVEVPTLPKDCPVHKDYTKLIDELT